jgi:hypothetical protein
MTGRNRRAKSARRWTRLCNRCSKRNMFYDSIAMSFVAWQRASFVNISMICVESYIAPITDALAAASAPRLCF